MNCIYFKIHSSSWEKPYMRLSALREDLLKFDRSTFELKSEVQKFVEDKVSTGTEFLFFRVCNLMSESVRALSNEPDFCD